MMHDARRPYDIISFLAYSLRLHLPSASLTPFSVSCLRLRHSIPYPYPSQTTLFGLRRIFLRTCLRLCTCLSSDSPALGPSLRPVARTSRVMALSLLNHPVIPRSWPTPHLSHSSPDPAVSRHSAFPASSPSLFVIELTHTLQSRAVHLFRIHEEVRLMSDSKFR
ncbi:hypothetical protein EDB89DRAFT_1234637 [Lactarius sanguifluus]|nr:hypothetical protein EDB89DRAFT_1234637 [Lactarius sanguifluus]